MRSLAACICPARVIRQSGVLWNMLVLQARAHVKRCAWQDIVVSRVVCQSAWQSLPEDRVVQFCIASICEEGRWQRACAKHIRRQEHLQQHATWLHHVFRFAQHAEDSRVGACIIPCLLAEVTHLLHPAALSCFRTLTYARSSLPSDAISIVCRLQSPAEYVPAKAGQPPFFADRRNI